jgi:AcrR family transcriptional regulator
MVHATRMTADERKQAIVEALVPLFAEHGFEGVTTREMAKVAGVSEALLYKHFPSKEAMFDAIQSHLERTTLLDPTVRAFVALPPSTEKLVMGIHMLICHLMLEQDTEHKILPRLMLQSLLSDGTFARTVLHRFQKDWFSMLEQSYLAAQKAGDLQGTELPASFFLWMTHHLAFTLKVMALPEKVPVNYHMEREKIAKESVRFVLRGMGFSPALLCQLYP